MQGLQGTLTPALLKHVMLSILFVECENSRSSSTMRICRACLRHTHTHTHSRGSRSLGVAFGCFLRLGGTTYVALHHLASWLAFRLPSLTKGKSSRLRTETIQATRYEVRIRQWVARPRALIMPKAGRGYNDREKRPRVYFCKGY
jgi:hypothetical protein